MEVGNAIAGSAVRVGQARNRGIGHDFPFAGNVQGKRGILHCNSGRPVVLTWVSRRT
jgi:hypothetical protein